MIADREVSYQVDGLRLRATILEPAGRPPFPGLVVNHGGITGIDERVLARGRRFRDRGYAVILPTFRGEGGSEGDCDVAAGDVRDSLGALEVLAAREGVDRARIGMWGNSRGGLTTLLAAEATDALRCAATSAAILSAEDLHDIFAAKRNPALAEVLRMMGGTPAERPDEYARRSPLTRMERLRCPLLVLHAEDDDVVNPRSAREIEGALRRTGHRDHLVRTFPSGGHRVVFDNAEASALLDEFLDGHLAPGRS